MFRPCANAKFLWSDYGKESRFSAKISTSTMIFTNSSKLAVGAHIGNVRSKNLHARSGPARVDRSGVTQKHRSGDHSSPKIGRVTISRQSQMDQKSVVERSFRGEPPPCIVFLQFGRQCLGQFFQIEQIVIVDAPNAKARFFYQAIGVTGLDTALVLGVPTNSSGRS